MKELINILFWKLRAHNNITHKKLILQFIKFGLVGVSNTLVAWAVYYLFLYFNENLYMIGSITGTILSIANAFVWNDKFVFTGSKNDWLSKLKRLGKTYISYGFTSILSTLLLWVEVQYWNVDKSIAPIINLLITIPLNFIINKYWTFRKNINREEV